MRSIARLLSDVSFCFSAAVCCVLLVGCAPELPDATVNFEKIKLDQAAPNANSEDQPAETHQDALVTISQIDEDENYTGPAFLHDDDPTAAGWMAEDTNRGLPKFIYDRAPKTIGRIEEDEKLSPPQLPSGAKTLFGIDYREDNGRPQGEKPTEIFNP